jgi:transposase-like protein
MPNDKTQTTIRWTKRRKTSIVTEIVGGHKSVASAINEFGLSEEEVREWLTKYYPQHEIRGRSQWF